MFRRGFIVLGLILAGGQLLAGEPQLISLASVIEEVAQNNPGLKAARSRVEKARLQIEKAEYLRFLTKFDLTMTTGVLPGSDPEDYFRDLGAFVKSEIAIVQPIFTFGKVSSAIELARHGYEHELEKYADTTQQAAFEVIRLYRGLETALKGELVARDMIKDFNKLTNEIEKELAKEDSTFDDLDRLDIKTKSWQIWNVYWAALEDRTNLMRAMNLALGQNEATELRLADEPLPEIVIQVENHERLVKSTIEQHPNFKGLRAALAASEAKLALEEANQYPDIFLGGGFRFNWASNRPSSDDYNSKGVGAFVGLRWRLDFWRSGNEIDQAKADRDAVCSGIQFSEERFRHDLDKALSGARRSIDGLSRVRESRAAAKTYVRLAADNYDMGFGSARTMINGYKTLYELEAAELRQELETHLALARLALLLGDITKYTEWIKNGKILLD